MYGCYAEVVFNVEVVFNFVAKARHHPNLVPVVFQFSYISLHTLSFLKMFFYYSFIIILSISKNKMGIMKIRTASVLVTRIFPIFCFAVYDQHLAV